MGKKVSLLNFMLAFGSKGFAALGAAGGSITFDLACRNRYVPAPIIAREAAIPPMIAFVFMVIRVAFVRVTAAAPVERAAPLITAPSPAGTATILALNFVASRTLVI